MNDQEDRPDPQVRTYDRFESVVFLKTKAEFGGLSNMAAGFDLVVNGIHILTAEALYQACRFPHLPAVQLLILEQTSPMSAKMKSRPYRSESRHDWAQVRLGVMRWCLRVKLAQNWAPFSKLLLATADRAVVEESRRDDFWGAKPLDDRLLVGRNVLGRLLMELRSEIREGSLDSFSEIPPLAIPQFELAGRPIEAVSSTDGVEMRSRSVPPEPVTRHRAPHRGRRPRTQIEQQTLSEWLLPEEEG
jgi:type I restriction enzyme S subunit